MQRSELRIYGGLLLTGMLAVLALLSGVHLSRKPQALARYILTDLGATAGKTTMSHNTVPTPGSDLRVRNRRGQMLGSYNLPGNRGVHAVLLNHGKSRDLGTLGGKVSYAVAINDAGEVTGSARTDHSLHAFLWQDRSMLDLGTLGGRNSWAWDLDAWGRVVGEADTSSGDTQAFLYDQGIMTDLGTLGGGQSASRSINDRGEIVGDAEIVSGDLHAFIYRDGRMTDLNEQTELPKGWTLTSATRIDDAGRIWGEGICHYVVHSFLLTPISS